MTLLQLTDFWKDISLRHKDINDFQVGSNYDAAVAQNKYPLVFWELPYSINYPDLNKPKNTIQVSLAVYLATKTDSIKDDNEAISLAKEIGDAIIAKARQEAGSLFTVDAVNAISVREYSDDNCAGLRYDLTLTIIQEMTPVCVDFNTIFNG